MIAVALAAGSTAAVADGAGSWVGLRPALVETCVRRFLASSDRGILIRRVAPGSPAARAGIQARDTILAWNGRDVRCWSDVVRSVRDSAPGTIVTARIARRDWSARHGWSERDVEIVIGTRDR